MRVLTVFYCNALWTLETLVSDQAIVDNYMETSYIELNNKNCMAIVLYVYARYLFIFQGVFLLYSLCISLVFV